MDKDTDIRGKVLAYVRPVLAGLAVFIVLGILQSMLQGEEARVRRVILRGRQAVEAKRIVDCATLVSTAYSDKYGYDRSMLIYLAKEAFNYYKSISIYIEDMTISVDRVKKEARAEVTATVLCQTQGGERENIFEGDRGRAKARFIKEDGAWKLLEVEFYEPVNVMGLTLQ